MTLNNRLIKTVSCLMSAVFVLTSAFSSSSFADVAVQEEQHISYEDDSPQKRRVVVSMGDSFSAGEGISPFYGDRNTEDDVIDDWLAHRSKLAWSGMLYLNKDNQQDVLALHKASYISNKKENDDTAWYFVASSGAVTDDLYGKQKKRFTRMESGELKFYDAWLDPQIEIFDKVKKEEKVAPDYITLTLGGNDVGFVDVLGSVGTGFGFINPNGTMDKLNEALKKLTRGDGNGGKSIRDKLRDAYINIDKAASTGDKKPCIIVAGYPRLLNENVLNADWGYSRYEVIPKMIIRSGWFFDFDEAERVNKCIDYFDETIKQIVQQCKRKDGLNIEFVDVREEFKDHAVYSRDPWINGVDLIPHDDDLITIPIAPKDNEDGVDPNPSGCSIHPNAKGAYYGYRKCVQDKIDKLEAAKNKQTTTPEPEITPTVPPESEPSNTKDPVSNKKVITFGYYAGTELEWLVLDENEDEMLLLSKYIVDKRAYNDERTPTTWKDCSLRNWLNKNFYKNAFNAKERKRIIQSSNISIDNRINGNDGGEDTKDRIFLLNSDEFALYLGSEDAESATAKIDESYDAHFSWWLRNPGYFAEMASYIDNNGYPNDLGEFVDIGTFGVRPAMWITKSEAKAATPTPTPAPEVTPTPTPAPDPDAKVIIEEARREEYDYYESKLVNRYPKITIKGVDTSAINKKMAKALTTKVKPLGDNMFDGKAANYEYYIGDHIVTILAYLDELSFEYRDYYVYNISIATGKEMSGSQVLKDAGLSDKKFFEIVKKRYKDFGAGVPNRPKSMVDKNVKKNLKLVSFKYVRPYYDKDGKLRFMGKVYYIAADGYGDMPFWVYDKDIPKDDA